MDKGYGLWERLVTTTTCFSTSIAEVRDGFSNPASIVESIKKVRGAIGNEAGILVPSCNILNMFWLTQA